MMKIFSCYFLIEVENPPRELLASLGLSEKKDEVAALKLPTTLFQATPGPSPSSSRATGQCSYYLLFCFFA